jgi:hypothetical protein
MSAKNVTPTGGDVDAMGIARELILRPSGLDDRRLDRVFGEVLTHSVDSADLYFQLSRDEAWSLEDGIVKDGSRCARACGREEGICLFG